MPDLDVWLALSWVNHIHSDTARAWFTEQGNNSFYFCRLTRLGLLRLLTTSSIMGDETMTVGQALEVYDRWMKDSRVHLCRESLRLQFDKTFRSAVSSVWKTSSPEALAYRYRYLLARSQDINATLVTFDRGLNTACQEMRQPVTLLKTAAV